MSGLSNPTSTGNITYVSLKEEKDSGLWFMKKEKINGAWTVTDKYKELTGRLKDIKFKTLEAKGDTFEIISFLFDCGKTDVSVEASFNMLSRGLLNSFIGNRDQLTREVKISLYTNQKGYSAIYTVFQDRDEKLEWAYSLDQVPKAKEMTFKGKTIRDYTDVDNFFKSEAEKLLKPVLDANEKNALPTGMVSSPSPETNKTSPPNAPMPCEDDDLPF